MKNDNPHRERLEVILIGPDVSDSITREKTWGSGNVSHPVHPTNSALPYCQLKL